MPDTQLILRYAARSDVGRLRSKNDDSAYAGRHLAVVADGMGGHAGGDVASASTVLDLVHLDRGGYAGDAGTVLADEIQTANSLLSELVSANPKLAGMGTTVTAILLNGSKLAFAHIGDSRAYRLRGTAFEQMSVDHTFVQRLINEGRLRPEEAETHPHKNVLMRVLGDVDASPELDLTSFDVEEGERWLLCSDGLNYVPHEIVEQTVRDVDDLAECADRLISLTLAAGAPDNVTVVVADIVADTAAAGEGSDAVPVAAPAAAAPVTASAAARTPVTSAARAESPQPHAHEAVEDRRAEVAGPGRTDDDGDARLAGSSPDASAASVGPGAGDAVAGSGGTGAEPPFRRELPTDPNLGAHLSAEVLRRELDSRPHELVGAAAAAAEAGSLPSVASRTAARRAAALLTHRASDAEMDLEETDSESAPRPATRWFRLILAAVVAVAIVLGLWLGYAWTQTRYYVGASDDHVAIFNGVSQPLGPFSLSKVYAPTDIPMSSLPDFQQQTLRRGVPADSLTEAEKLVAQLRTNPQSCLTSPPSASPSPSTTAGAVPPSGQATTSSTASLPAFASPSPSASPSSTNPCLGGH
ncbi:PP2C family serine/threonine-protein phosphatase [Sinomonas sp. JGH33]|uniref:PP2C family serine/threonine-protein phosphatase n=1 Tax=Sinomonas terricola TaxID=3110330 RepID=A0ABU5TCB7_9MICC|nr:PP2C family serine/threonine-protein phosphatase [Sinomonas sp. JGH33]MEA5457338.1 PP2C family serine/threonine-protein phosphatase [Sinomonas sp. JGH33]